MQLCSIVCIQAYTLLYNFARYHGTVCPWGSPSLEATAVESGWYSILLGFGIAKWRSGGADYLCLQCKSKSNGNDSAKIHLQVTAQKPKPCWFHRRCCKWQQSLLNKQTFCEIALTSSMLIYVTNWIYKRDSCAVLPDSIGVLGLACVSLLPAAQLRSLYPARDRFKVQPESTLCIKRYRQYMPQRLPQLMHMMVF